MEINENRLDEKLEANFDRMVEIDLAEMKIELLSFWRKLRLNVLVETTNAHQIMSYLRYITGIATIIIHILVEFLKVKTLYFLLFNRNIQRLPF